MGVMKEGDTLYFRVSKGGEGIWITNGKVSFGLMGNRQRVKDVINGKEEWTDLTAVKKTKPGDIINGQYK